LIEPETRRTKQSFVRNRVPKPEFGNEESLGSARLRRAVLGVPPETFYANRHRRMVDLKIHSKDPDSARRG
jgi:hypothetical protein